MNYFRSLFFIALVLPMTSCIKYYDTVRSEFPQAKDQVDPQAAARSAVRSETVYDQFRTLAIFDALWLSDMVREAYVDFHAHKNGLNLDGKENLLIKEKEQNKEIISFYVLAEVRDRGHISLEDKNSLWSLYLTNESGWKLQPKSIKEVELAPEYKKFFGHHKVTPFKTPYLVTFDKNEFVLNQDSLGSGLKLVIGSAEKKVEFVWDDNEPVKKKMGSDEDFYWG